MGLVSVDMILASVVSDEPWIWAVMYSLVMILVSCEQMELTSGLVRQVMDLGSSLQWANESIHQSRF